MFVEIVQALGIVLWGVAILGFVVKADSLRDEDESNQI
jgi:hypothetical protein